MSTRAGYAVGTDVPVERSRAEIDAVLTKNGATSVAILNDEENFRAAFIFTMKGIRFKVELPLPKPEDVGPTKGKEPQRWWSYGEQQRADWRTARLAQLRKERWRQMLLLLKAKLEIVRIGLSTVEHEFMADMLLPSGQTAAVVLAEELRRGLNGTDDLPKLGMGAS